MLFLVKKNQTPYAHNSKICATRLTEKFFLGQNVLEKNSIIIIKHMHNKVYDTRVICCTTIIKAAETRI